MTDHWTDDMPKDLSDAAANVVSSLDILLERMRVDYYVPCEQDLKYVLGEARRAKRQRAKDDTTKATR